MAKTREYQVQAKLELLISISTNASSLLEAIEKSKNLKEDSFADIIGDYVDGEMRITGVYESAP